MVGGKKGWWEGSRIVVGMVGRKEGLFGGRERGMVCRREGWNKKKI